MNFRVFLLIGAIGAFGALWSSDGRYQTEQIALVRAERKRSANANLVFIAKIKTDVTDLKEKLAHQIANIARSTSAAAAVPAISKARPIFTDKNDAIVLDALFGRLVVAWVFNRDPGNGVSVLTRQATLAKARLEERFCLMRFQTREAAFFAGRRATAFLRAHMSAPQQPGRMARIIIREVPIEESQAPAAGGRQTR
jgi:hypothetical protein